MPGEKDFRAPTTLTREELHALVWQTPMMHLAERFGISGNGLAKICARLEIPVPPRGYWAKKAAGKKVPITPLPTGTLDVQAIVKIRPTPPLSAEDASPRAIAEEIAAGIKIKVSDRLTKPHSIIAGWLDDHERRKREAKEHRDPWRRDLYTPQAWTEQDRRSHRVFDALFKELEIHGASIRQDEQRGLFVDVDGQKIEFAMREKQKQVRRPLTEKEKRWETWNKDGMKTELVGTGCLVFAIKSYLVGNLRKEWLEKAGKPIESMLAEIAATFLATGPLLKEQAKRRAEEAERYAAEQRRREEERRLQQENRNRVRRLVEISGAWRDFEIAREFLNELEQWDYNPDELVGDRSIQEWLAWAREQIEIQNPIGFGVRAVLADISRVTSWTYRD